MIEIFFVIFIGCLVIALMFCMYRFIGLILEDFISDWLYKDDKAHQLYSSMDDRIAYWPKALLLALVVRREYIKENPKESISFKQIFERYKGE